MRVASFRRTSAELRRLMLFMVLAGVVGAVSAQPQRAVPAASGVRLEDLTWPMAEQRLTADSVVVVPLGAASQEHGLHLRLRNDQAIADYLTKRLLELSDVVAAPLMPYHYFPAFSEYPGSTSLSLNTARDLTADIARSLSRHGPRRFYVLNVGVTSSQALAAAAKLLANEGILLGYTDWQARIDALRPQQPGGNHADEIETSLMLHIDPSAVNMASAQRDYTSQATTPFQLTRRPGGRGIYSPSGAWGDPTAATREKGRMMADSLVAAIRNDIDALRRATLPVASVTPPPLTAAPPPMNRPQGAPRTTGECLPGDERYIREIGPKFYLAWREQDAPRLASLWYDGGDMAHPDGLVETTAQVIRENRHYLFQQKEFRNSRHYLTIGTVRCITYDVAVVDAKWELSGVTDGRGSLTPAAEGLCTLVMRRLGSGWVIEAWRYNMKPTTQATQPTILKKPGFPTTIR